MQEKKIIYYLSRLGIARRYSKAVDLVKAGNIKESGKRLEPLLKKSYGKKKNVPIIAGCTELPPRIQRS